MKVAAGMAALALLAPAAAGAQGLSRAQAVEQALQANPQVKKSQEESARLQGIITEARADALPDLTVSGNGLRYRDPALLNSSSFDAFPPDLRESLRPIPANLYDGALTLKQTLFSFRLGGAIRAARVAMKLGHEQVERARQAIALDAVRAYNTYVFGLEQVNVAEKAVRQKEKHLEMARNRRVAGVATDLDVLRSQVDLENQKAQLRRIAGDADRSRARLNAVMVRPIDEPIEPSDSLRFEPLEATLEGIVREAWARRPELKSAELSERFREELIGVAVADGRPRLELNGAFGYSVRRPGDFFTRDFEKWAGSVSLTVPVFDGFRTSGKVAQARAERAKASQDRIEIENQIRLEAQDALAQLNTAGAVLQSATLNVSQAEQALSMTQANYSHGAATTLDVLDAQAALTLAEIIQVQGLYEHANARATVRYVMGHDPLEEKP
jgi:outer membrane protein TolC